MTAIAVIAIISGPLLYMFITSSRVERHSYDVDKANTVAVGIVEGLKANPADINETNFFYTPEYDEETHHTIHTYTRTDYFNKSWQGTDAASADYYAAITLTGEDNSDDGISLSYIPELVCKSGAQAGENYSIVTDYNSVSSGDCEFTVDVSGNDYTIAATQAIFINTLNGAGATAFVTIPKEDCVANIIPLVVDIGSNPNNHIKFIVNNKTTIETALYVYGDYGNDPHYITTSPTSGTLSINYMKVSSKPLDYDKLDVNVKVHRVAQDDVIADYTTLIYFANSES